MKRETAALIFSFSAGFAFATIIWAGVDMFTTPERLFHTGDMMMGQGAAFGLLAISRLLKWNIVE